MGSKSKVKSIIIRELEEVAKKYGKPRRTMILYADEVEEAEVVEETPDYPVNLFFTREAILRRSPPVPAHERRAETQRGGTRSPSSWRTPTARTCCFFSDRCQVYKLKASDFDDTKASVLGEYIPAKAQMDEGERAVYLAPTKDYAGFLLFFLRKRQGRQGGDERLPDEDEPEKADQRLQRQIPPWQLLSICGRTVRCCLQLPSGRMLLFHTGLIQPKATKNTQGVQAMNLKKGPEGDGGRCL